jgi:RNA polymerase sigma factor (sigma-70 family)
MAVCGMISAVAEHLPGMNGGFFAGQPQDPTRTTSTRRTAARLTVTKSILERIAAGDSAAVSECMDRYGDLVWSLARRYLRNPTDAEDAVQDIFIDIWGSCARYDRNIASEIAFISTIARRRLIDRIRHTGRRPAMDSLDDEDNAVLEPAVAATAEDDTEVGIVERVLGEMAPEHQKVLTMSLYEGYSHSEIAERLDLPLGTVKTRVRRGLIHIREQLQIKGAGDPAEELAG